MLTIGHSNRPADVFVAMLQAHGVELVADIRTVPRSRHNPQFNRETLPGTLAAAGTEYVHLAGLGGLRHPQPESPNTGWRNLSFRGYADYMQTAEFAAALNNLLELARNKCVAMMCAEAVPWRCHRSLVADALHARRVEVEHILSTSRREPHRLTSFARIDSGRVWYPSPELELFASKQT